MGFQTPNTDRIGTHRAFLIVPAQAIVGKWLESFKEYPIRQRAASFNLDAVMQKLTANVQ